MNVVKLLNQYYKTQQAYDEALGKLHKLVFEQPLVVVHKDGTGVLIERVDGRLKFTNVDVVPYREEDYV